MSRELWEWQFIIIGKAIRMEKMNCYSPVSGEVVDLDKVKDPVFAGRVLGDGIAVYPAETTVSAPVDGVLKLIFHTGHAFVIEMESGDEIMVHIGVNTVTYQGKGFEILKKQGEKVYAGEEVVRFSPDYLSSSDMTTMVILMDERKKKRVTETKKGACTRGKDIILKWKSL